MTRQTKRVRSVLSESRGVLNSPSLPHEVECVSKFMVSAERVFENSSDVSSSVWVTYMVKSTAQKVHTGHGSM